MNIRDYIKKNLGECKEIDVRETVLASINQDDEIVLPNINDSKAPCQPVNNND